MAVQITDALTKIQEAAETLFDSDPTVRSVGVGKATDGFAFVAVRNIRAPIALAAAVGPKAKTPDFIAGIPVHFQNSYNEPQNLARVPHTGPASPGVGSLIPEQQFQRPLVCGLQIQNFDDDVRTGEINKGYIIIGTLGCFVQLADNTVAILSNNHVVAGQNGGINGADRIQQPGGSVFDPKMHVAMLTDFVALRPSPAGASIGAGTVVLNDVDGGVAVLQNNPVYVQGYLASRAVKAPQGVATASIGDKVYKVGRTTGLTYGTVKQVGVVVGPIGYDPDNCWFQQCLIIEGENGATFSDHGDSGSAIVRDDGMMVGLLFAGNGVQTYACAVDGVMKQLNCRLV
jgi:hypothetical protein